MSKGGTPSTGNLYQRLGGEPAVRRAVEIFYRKVLADGRLNHFFDGIDMDRQIEKQQAFLMFAFGGPHHYSGRDLRTAHEKLVERGLNDDHFDAIIDHLAATLEQLGLSDDLIAECVAITEGTRNDVLGR